MTYVRKSGWVLGCLVFGVMNAQDTQVDQPATLADQAPASQAAPGAVPQGQSQINSSVPLANVSQALDSQAGNENPADSATMKADSAAPASNNVSESLNIPKAQDPKSGNTQPVPPTAPTPPAIPDRAPQIAEPVAQPTAPELQPIAKPAEPAAAPVQPASVPEQTLQAPQPVPSGGAPAAAPVQADVQPAMQPEVKPQPTIEAAQPAPAMNQPHQRPVRNQSTPSRKPEAVKPAADELVGLDTVDLENPQGNWLFKRVWWERAEEKYEQIHELVTKTTEARTAFFAKRNEIEKSVLDPFYLNIGFSQGELQAVLADLNSNLEIAEKTKQSQEKEDAEQAVMDSAQEEAQALKNLQQDVEQVIKHDETLDSAIMQLTEQITRMRNYEQQAWQDFKDIARVLDDKKARELFYKVDNALRNVQEIQAYIEQGFSTSFDRISEQIKQSVTRITSTIATLREKGFDLKKRAQELAGDIQEEKPQEQSGIFARFITNPIKRFFTGVASVIQMIWDYTVFMVKWPFQKIMGSAAPEASEEQAQEMPESTIQDAQAQEETAALEPEEQVEHVQDAVAQAELDSPELPDTMEEIDLHELALNERGSFDSFDSEASCDTPSTVMA